MSIMPSESSLFTVPNEILVRILAELDPESLLTSRLVCRFLGRLVREDISLQYKLELARAGMVDGPGHGDSGGLTIQDRLESLRAYQDAWRNPSVNICQTACRPDSDIGRMWPLTDSLLICPTRDGLDFWRPGSAIRRAPQEKIRTKAWMQHVRYSAVTGCAVDEEQDLLAITTEVQLGSTSTKCYLFSLSHDGLPHPLAAQHALHADFPDYLSGISQDCQRVDILGDLCLWTVQYVNQVQIWNWKKGELLWQYVPPPEVAAWDDFFQGTSMDKLHARLLDCSSLLLQHGTDLYLYDTGPSTCGSSPMPVRAGPSDCACRLDLPTSSVGGRDIDLHIHRPSTSSGYPAFQHNIALTIVIIHLRPSRYHHSTEHALLLVPVTTLLSLLHNIRERVASNLDVVRNIPWADWGPSGSRLIKAENLRGLSLLGSKLAISFIRGLECHVYIIELNPLFPQSGEKLPHVDYSEHIDPTKRFPTVITTMFPCRVTRHRVALKFSGDYLRLVLFHDGWALIPYLGSDYNNKPADGYIFTT